jgi:hypothetical protein
LFICFSEWAPRIEAQWWALGSFISWHPGSHWCSLLDWCCTFGCQWLVSKRFSCFWLSATSMEKWPQYCHGYIWVVPWIQVELMALVARLLSVHLVDMHHLRQDCSLAGGQWFTLATLVADLPMNTKVCVWDLRCRVMPLCGLVGGTSVSGEHVPPIGDYMNTKVWVFTSTQHWSLPWPRGI